MLKVPTVRENRARRRNVRDRVSALAPFLTYDPDPYMVVGDTVRLSWIMDPFTVSDSYPYSSHYHLDRDPINYVRNSVKVVIDAYSGATTFYVFDKEDPILAVYRSIFPSLFGTFLAQRLRGRAPAY
jgi:uncharacterized membrane protein (UPF0182 family)